MRILLTGRTGQVGAELARTLRPLGELHAPVRPELALSDPDAIIATVRELRPDLIVSAAAFTDPERAERHPDEALAVNAHAPEVLAEEALGVGAAMIHFSCGDVFDGTKEAPYDEDDVPAPRGVCGRTTLLGEQGVRASGVPHVILRVAWVYGPRRRNPLTAMLDQFALRRAVRVAPDELVGPTSSRAIARATAELVTSALEPRPGAPAEVGGAADLAAVFAERGGTFHLGSAGEVTPYAFAEEVARLLRRSGGPALRLEPAASPSANAAAGRPRNRCLDGRRLRERFGVSLPPWEEQLEACVAELEERRRRLVG